MYSSSNNFSSIPEIVTDGFVQEINIKQKMEINYYFFNSTDK